MIEFNSSVNHFFKMLNFDNYFLMADNLTQQLEINKAISRRRAMLEKQTDEMQKQLDISKQLFAVQKNMAGTSLEDIITELGEMQNALEDVREEQEGTFSSFGGIIQDAAKKSVNFGVVWRNIRDHFGGLANKVKKTNPVIFSFFDGFGKGLKFSFNILRGFAGLIGTAVKGLFQMGVAILSIPFKFLNGLFALANKMTAMWVENAKAVEEIRKQFGDLSQTTGKEVMGAFRGLSGVMGSFGASMYSVFGTAAERLAYVNELFKGLGPTVNSFGKEIKQNIKTIGLFQKGLGIPLETMGDLGIRAKSLGTSFTSQFKRISDMSLSLGKKFDISGKLISRSIGGMIKDVEHFGTLSVKTMAESATYMESLGLEVKALAGIVDKFLNFEDAALSAAKLSQVFGANVDALKMMKEAGKDPAKAFSRLQEAMFKAGRTTEDMTLAELRFLGKTVNLTAQEAKLAFSMKARGKSLEEIKKASAETAKEQLTLEQSIQQVSGAVERLVKNIPAFTGFFDAFLKGFSRGLLHSRGFHKSLRDLNKSAMAVARGGIQIGKAFMKSFPGVKQFWQGFQKLFDPKEVKKLMDKFVGFFDNFAKDLKDPTKMKNALSGLIENIKNAFYDFFEINDEIESGLKTFATTIKDLIVQSAPIIVGGIADLFFTITALLSNPEQFVNPAKAGADSISSFISPIIVAFKDAANDKALGTALLRFATLVIDKAVQLLLAVIKTYPWETALVLLGPAIVGALWSALVTALVTMVPWSAIGGYILGGLITAFKAFPITKAIIAFGLTIYRIFEGWGKAKTGWDKVTLIFREAIRSILDVLTFGLWSFIPGIEEWFDDVFDEFGKWIPKIGTALRFMFEDAGSIISAVWGPMWDRIVRGFDGLVDGIKYVGKKIIKGIKAFSHTAWKFLKNNFPLFKLIDMIRKEGFEDTMTKVGDSMSEGLKKGFEKIKDFLPDSLTTAIKVVKKILEARSPSRVFMGIGNNMSDGIKLGIKDIPTHMDKVMSRAIENSQNSMKTNMQTLHGMNRQIEKDLSSTPSLAADVRMGKNMKIKDKKIEIQHKDLKLELNLNVVLDADDTATALAKTKKLVSRGTQFN